MLGEQKEKKNGDMAKWYRGWFDGAFIGQLWENLNIKKNNDNNGL